MLRLARTHAPRLLAPLVAAALLLSAWFQEEAAPSARSADDLEVIYLANEGFLLRRGERAVLIDAFVASPYAGYPALPATLAADLEAARVPFDAIALALVSHVHADHFQAQAALPFLLASSKTRMLSSPQVLDALLALDGADALGDRLDARLPEAGERLVDDVDGMRVEFLRLPHGGGASAADVQNVAHVIELEGVRLLHVGDAEMDPGVFAPYHLEERGLDVACVPYWFFLEAEGRALLARHVAARRYVAMHLPIEGRQGVLAELARVVPEVSAFDLPLAAVRVQRATPAADGGR